MTEQKPENPPAFPQQTQMMRFRQNPDGTTEAEPVGHPVMRGGMTLRDYFAAAALTGLLANQQIAKDAVKEGYGPDVTQPWHADTAYAFADAMLKKRSEEA